MQWSDTGTPYNIRLYGVHGDMHVNDVGAAGKSPAPYIATNLSLTNQRVLCIFRFCTTSVDGKLNYVVRIYVSLTIALLLDVSA